MPRFRLLSLVILATVVLTAACGTVAGTPGTDQVGTSGGGAENLQFTARTVDDQAFQGSSLAGKDAVLWFWASWCTECRREASDVAAVQAATAGQVSFVGVAGLGDVPGMQAFVTDNGVAAFPHLADLDGTLWSRFGVVRLPAYAFIDDSGRVEVVRGALDRDGLAAKVAELTANRLEASPTP